MFAEKRADIGIAFHSVAVAFLCAVAKSATVTKIRIASVSAETIQLTMYRRLKLSTPKAKLFSINTYIHIQAPEIQLLLSLVAIVLIWGTGATTRISKCYK